MAVSGADEPARHLKGVLAAVTVMITTSLVEPARATRGGGGGGALNPPAGEPSDATFDAMFPFTWVDVAMVSCVSALILVLGFALRAWLLRLGGRAEKPAPGDGWAA